jgi:flagellar hook-associated protein FlgK
MVIGSAAIQGMWAHQAMFTTAAHNIANVNTPPAAGEQPVELTEEIPAMIVAGHGYTANARVLSVQDEMSGALIDVLG